MVIDGYGNGMAFTSALVDATLLVPRGGADASWSGSYAKGDELQKPSKGLFCPIRTSPEQSLYL